MLIQRGPNGVEGLGFTSTEEVTLVASAAMYNRQRWFVDDNFFNRHSPVWLSRGIEWLGERTLAVKRAHLLQALAQQALLNAELEERQEARLDLTHSAELSGVAVDSLRYYLAYVERVVPNAPPEDQALTQPTVDLARDMVTQINGTPQLIHAYASDPFYQ